MGKYSKPLPSHITLYGVTTGGIPNLRYNKLSVEMDIYHEDDISTIASEALVEVSAEFPNVSGVERMVIEIDFTE